MPLALELSDLSGRVQSGERGHLREGLGELRPAASEQKL